MEFTIFVEKYRVMVRKVFLSLGILFLILGNVLCYHYNDRLLHPMTNLCFVFIVNIIYYEKEHLFICQKDYLR